MNASPVEYVPPDDAQIRAFAQDACTALARQRANPGCAAPEIVQGLADFLQITSTIVARSLSQRQPFDKPSN